MMGVNNRIDHTYNTDYCSTKKVVLIRNNCYASMRLQPNTENTGNHSGFNQEF